MMPTNHKSIEMLYDLFSKNQTQIPEYSLLFRDPIAFDRLAFKWLFSKYGNHLKKVLEKLYSKDNFLSSKLSDDFKKYLDPSLVCKQLLPLFATADAFGALEEHDNELVNTGVAYVLTKTAALNFIDTHVDLSLSYNIRKDIVEARDSRFSVLFSITSIFRGCDLFLNLPNGDKLLKIITEVFAHVMEIMTDDYCARFDRNILINPSKRLVLYNNDFLSPFLGSGFYEATVRSSLLIIGKKESHYLIDWVRNFRKLRQLVDEIADIQEDIRVGRITYPILLGLKNPRFRKNINRTIEKIWHSSEQIIRNSNPSDMDTIEKLKMNEVINKNIIELFKNLSRGGVWDELYERTDTLYIDLVNNFSRAFPGASNCIGLIMVILLKRAFLERLRQQNWIDNPVESIFVADQTDFKNNQKIKKTNVF